MALKPKDVRVPLPMQLILDCHWLVCVWGEGLTDRSITKTRTCYMNDAFYIALFVYCCTPKALYNHVGGGLSSTTTSVQHPFGWCDGCHRTTAPVRSPHTSYRWRGEREIEPIKWMGIIRRPWLTRASGGNLARTPGLHLTLYEKCHGIFNDHRELGPRFNISSERRMRRFHAISKRKAERTSAYGKVWIFD